LWALAQRLPRGATLESVGDELDAGQFIRTHGPRPTWHFLAPEDCRWILALVGPRVERQSATINRREGLDPTTLSRGLGILQGALAGRKALTRPELGAALAAGGIDGAAGLRLGQIVMHAELRAVICSGPRRGRQNTYQLVEERMPPAPPCDRDDAPRELAVRYFQSHGPALAHDMAWWSGLTVGDVRRGIELAGDALQGRSVDGKEYWAATGAFDPDPVPEPFVRLLSNYDEYLGSYVDYSPIFDPSLPKARNVADVLGAHIVVRDGFVVGGWRRGLGRDRATVTVTLLLPLTTAEMAALHVEADAYGTFLGQPVDLVMAQP
jgi:winged helix DNA-binding protein